MKVILVGASGFIGSAVLRRCLQLPEVTAVVVLARRPLAGVSDPKLTTLVHADFAVYPAELLKAHADAGACIWCVLRRSRTLQR
jgi:nucleoside-diphosphate-sugar epimerase